MLDTSQADALPLAPASVWPDTATRVLVPLFAATIFLSSFLMFTVEPMVARQMLPVLGGVPMVWNGCVVFFQAVLLAGYGGAHVLTRGVVAPTRLLVYAALAVLPWLFLRLGVDAASAAHATQAPLSWLLASLLTTVGPPFFVLAISASVLQATFSSTRHESAGDPYFLYAASNAGSLTALVAYPTIVETLLGLSRQARVWTVGYAVFVVLVLVCAVAARFALARGTAAVVEKPAEGAESGRITWTQRARWCVLAAVPSSLMLGVTTALTTDIAPVPLLWVAPLALYLLTFILAFGNARARATALANRLLPALLLGVGVTMMLRAQLQVGPALFVHLTPFLAAAMVCHGRLANERPAAAHLTEFYFWLALGGMIGGLFNALAAPVLFSRVVEYPLALAAVAFLRPPEEGRGGRTLLDWALPVIVVLLAGALLFGPRTSEQSPFIAAALGLCAAAALTRRHRRATFGVVVSVFLVASPWVQLTGQTVLETRRTFFGTYRVAFDAAERRHTLAHGTTLHGMQSVDPARRGEPLSYYHWTGPFGHVMESLGSLRGEGDIAAVGLGVGTLGVYARPGQRWTFYEIDPAVERIARDDRYFTFLKDCGGRCRVILGDARLSLAARADDRYRLIVLDAFSSDAIPMHLLTNDAMAVYLSRLAPGGALAFHISNRHLRLEGILGRLATANGLVALHRQDVRTAGATWPAGKTQSHWVVMARSWEDLGALVNDRAWTPPNVPAATPLWTDDFSNILDVLQLRLR